MVSRIVFLCVLILAVLAPSFADRQWSSLETEDLIRRLAENPRSGWIPQGALTAQRLVYHASDGIVIQSSEVVRCDGDRFLREIHITEHNAPRKGSLQSSQETVVDAENMKINQHRIYSWDGNQVTCYYPNAKYADIQETTLAPSELDKGALTAGFVPWGYGFYSLERLSDLKISIWEREEYKSRYLDMRIDATDSAVVLLRLDPGKGNSVLHLEMYQKEKRTLLQRYEGYQYLLNSWIPQTISIERYNVAADPPGLVSYEDWSLAVSQDKSIDSETMRPALSDGTLVAYKTSSLDKPLWYQQNNASDMAGLLAEKRVLSAIDPKQSNCASLAALYIARQFHIDNFTIRSDSWSQDGKVSLLNLKTSLEQSGLAAAAVKTDVEGLRRMKSGHAVLHLTDSFHYVVLDRIEGDYVWIIDLSANHFYYRRPIDTLRRQWTDGIALIVADPAQPTEMVAPRISEEEASAIFGSQQGGAGYYDCTDIVQPTEVILCSEPMGGYGGACEGRYWELAEVHGCEPSTGPNSCYGIGLPRGYYADCRNDPFDPLRCIKGETFALRQIRGCIP